MISVPITHVTSTSKGPFEAGKGAFQLDEPKGGRYDLTVSTYLALGCSFIFVSTIQNEVEMRIEYKDTLVCALTSKNNRTIYNNFMNLLDTYENDELIRVLRKINDIKEEQTDE